MASNNPQNLGNICDIVRSNNVTSVGSEDSEPSANVEYKEIKKPLSYLIFDTETTGLPGLYGNPRITELCLLGVHREDMMEDGVRIPRVVNKLQLCLNPQKRVTPGSSMITGLFNDALERQQPLNQDTIAIIQGFIQTQAQPACLIAHNGDKFDFPLLASELKAIQEELPQGLLCADSLLALRELDADSGQNSPIDMRLGQQTWDRTETTPVKRVIPDGEQEEAVLPKKPKKDFKSESLFENIERDKVAKKLQYTDQNENVKCNQNTELSVRKSNSGQQTNSSSDSKPLSASSIGDDSPDCVRNCPGAANEKMRKEINFEHTSDGLREKCDTNTESGPCTTHMFSPHSQGSLLDDDLLLAVTQIESGSNIFDLNQRENSQQDASLSMNTSKVQSECNRVTTAAHRVIKTPLTVPATSQTVSAAARTNPAAAQTVPAATQQQAVTSLCSSASTVEVSHSCNVCVDTCAACKLAKNSSFDTVVHPTLTSEATIIYNMEPAIKMEKTTCTELNSQGSLPDGAFLEAVQNMEMLQETDTSADVELSFTEKLKNQKDEVKVMDTVAKNHNSCQAGCSSDVAHSEGCLARAKCEVDRNGMIRSDLLKSKTPPTQIHASNGGKRRSFRLADIYKRHFGNPPQAAHTAEDDCISLLKIVKKFSPRFLDWVDENCVPFTTVKPMY